MKKTIDRRSFIKKAGGTALAMTSVGALAGCGKSSGKKDGKGSSDSGEMTSRTNKADGDKVSILGYGWMRLPRMKNPDNPNEEIINQEEVTRLCNKAFEYGVNYFDTSPAYCQGKSEESLGIALEQSGRSRDSYYIATKLSNFSPTQWRDISRN